MARVAMLTCILSWHVALSFTRPYTSKHVHRAVQPSPRGHLKMPQASYYVTVSQKKQKNKKQKGWNHSPSTKRSTKGLPNCLPKGLPNILPFVIRLKMIKEETEEEEDEEGAVAPLLYLTGKKKKKKKKDQCPHSSTWLARRRRRNRRQ